MPCSHLLCLMYECHGFSCFTEFQGLAAVYKAGMEEGAEFHPGQEGAEERQVMRHDQIFPLVYA